MNQADTIAFVSIGANLPRPGGGSPLETCRWAVNELDRLPGIAVRALSRWYETLPVPPSGQPSFVNAVAQLTLDPADQIDPAVLLTRLHAIEQGAERTRSVRNAARTLDLDLISMGSLVRASPDPVLPHPRAHLRLFVLVPLRDVAPGWIHPELGVGIDTLIAELAGQVVTPLLT